MGQPVDGPILRDIWAAGIELLKKIIWNGEYRKIEGISKDLRVEGGEYDQSTLDESQRINKNLF